MTNSYETTRNVLDVKSNATNGANPSVVSAFDYSVNNLGQRNDVSRTGSAFTSANTETWNYNAKGEVVTANSSNNAFDRSYEFDGIGNRKKSADSITLPAADNYSANTLNQLTTVNGVARPLVSHDADGNLTDDGEKLFVWDAENRLIEIKLKSDNSTVATYAYDYQSRRITKTVGVTETNFVYEGWNPIAKFSGTTLSKTYTWGMDLSGSMQGSGGVGGLLSVNDGSATFYPTYDGNGNVSEYVDATGNTVAHYEYDAFGQVVASGSKKDDFTHQFSTKQLDSESGLHYYGFRFYSAMIGCWLGRDPIEESGGLNLHAFVNNDGVNYWDYLGLTSKCCKDGKEVERSEECPIDIHVGHGGKLGNSTLPDWLKHSDCPVGIITCYGAAVDDELVRNGVPVYENPNRATQPITISPGSGANEIKAKFQQELDAAKQQAQKECSDKSKCCKNVVIRIYYSGLDGSERDRDIEFTMSYYIGHDNGDEVGNVQCN